MNARSFNQQFLPGSLMIYCPKDSVMGYGGVVRIMDKARDFKCGTIVEIDREPFFVKTDSLKPAR
ncbi:Uncharacterised protein [Cedecea neteri]|nr:hypothetical protein [Cedecea neteri]ATF92387.1 hypothetical protein CO704_09960 [Cedecea neteri]ATF93657.1 hypothetical protein CO704_16830 [Cedecea neteri]SQA96699.1 Uncharacterised protein [Cedecea neteri]